MRILRICTLIYVFFIYCITIGIEYVLHDSCDCDYMLYADACGDTGYHNCKNATVLNHHVLVYDPCSIHSIKQSDIDARLLELNDVFSELNADIDSKPNRARLIELFCNNILVPARYVMTHVFCDKHDKSMNHGMQIFNIMQKNIEREYAVNHSDLKQVVLENYRHYVCSQRIKNCYEACDMFCRYITSNRILCDGEQSRVWSIEKMHKAFKVLASIVDDYCKKNHPNLLSELKNKYDIFNDEPSNNVTDVLRTGNVDNIIGVYNRIVDMSQQMLKAMLYIAQQNKSVSMYCIDQFYRIVDSDGTYIMNLDADVVAHMNGVDSMIRCINQKDDYRKVVEFLDIGRVPLSWINSVASTKTSKCLKFVHALQCIDGNPVGAKILDRCRSMFSVNIQDVGSIKEKIANTLKVVKRNCVYIDTFGITVKALNDIFSIINCGSQKMGENKFLDRFFDQQENQIKDMILSTIVERKTKMQFVSSNIDNIIQQIHDTKINFIDSDISNVGALLNISNRVYVNIGFDSNVTVCGVKIYNKECVNGDSSKLCAVNVDIGTAIIHELLHLIHYCEDGNYNDLHCISSVLHNIDNQTQVYTNDEEVRTIMGFKDISHSNRAKHHFKTIINSYVNGGIGAHSIKQNDDENVDMQYDDLSEHEYIKAQINIYKQMSYDRCDNGSHYFRSDRGKRRGYRRNNKGIRLTNTSYCIKRSSRDMSDASYCTVRVGHGSYTKGACLSREMGRVIAKMWGYDYIQTDDSFMLVDRNL